MDEPSYIIGIVSITPRIDYSQGNRFDVDLDTLDDLHKPALDAIGYQDLTTNKMAWWDGKLSAENTVTVKTVGKQPAWLDYMTNYNKVFGNFAIPDNEMFMTLNRRYEINNDLTIYGFTPISRFLKLLCLRILLKFISLKTSTLGFLILYS